MANSFITVFAGFGLILLISIAAVGFYTTLSAETSTPITTIELKNMSDKLNDTMTSINSTIGGMTGQLNSNESGDALSQIISYSGVWSGATFLFKLVTFIPDMIATTLGLFKIIGAPYNYLIGYTAFIIVSGWLIVKIMDFFRGTGSLSR